jgi:hypothetical protein
VNKIAVASHPDLDERIAQAFANGAKSSDVATLLRHTQLAATKTTSEAERARAHALDPTLSGAELKDARKSMDDLAFKRDRLQAAITRLGERLKQLQNEEEDARRVVIYDKIKAERDKLAKEYADLYPTVAKQLADLLARIAANNHELDHVNKNALPKGAGRLLEAELIARDLPGWVQGGIQTDRVVDLLRLPPWQPRAYYLWPPGTR